MAEEHFKILDSQNLRLEKGEKRSSYLFLLIPIFFLVIGQTSSKYGALLLANSGASRMEILYHLNIYIFIGYICLFLRGIVWLVILRKFELSYAYPFLSISLVVVLLLSNRLFGEAITTLKIIGSFLIVMGVLVMSRSGEGKSQC
ncbi:MAG: hypothetical protein P8013_12040 [Candidatus Sulfobium sp.]|jgi:drug/metabolite transporter (DMT)-like permease